MAEKKNIREKEKKMGNEGMVCWCWRPLMYIYRWASPVHDTARRTRDPSDLKMGGDGSAQLSKGGYPPLRTVLGDGPKRQPLSDSKPNHSTMRRAKSKGPKFGLFMGRVHQHGKDPCGRSLKFSPSATTVFTMLHSDLGKRPSVLSTAWVNRQDGRACP